MSMLPPSSNMAETCINSTYPQKTGTDHRGACVASVEMLNLRVHDCPNSKSRLVHEAMSDIKTRDPKTQL